MGVCKVFFKFYEKSMPEFCLIFCIKFQHPNRKIVLFTFVCEKSYCEALEPSGAKMDPK